MGRKAVTGVDIAEHHPETVLDVAERLVDPDLSASREIH
jgi:hypothetical protein